MSTKPKNLLVISRDGGIDPCSSTYISPNKMCVYVFFFILSFPTVLKQQGTSSRSLPSANLIYQEDRFLADGSCNQVSASIYWTIETGRDYARKHRRRADGSTGLKDRILAAAIIKAKAMHDPP